MTLLLRTAVAFGIIATITRALAAQEPLTEDQMKNARAQRFIEQHVETIGPLETASNLTWWNANTTGRDEDFSAKQAAQEKLDAALAAADRFAELKAVKESDVPDKLLARQIDVLYLKYLEKQVDPALLQRLSAKANEIEQAFNVYRANVGDKEMTDSQVRRALRQSRDSQQREAVWKASKNVAAQVETDLKELVLLRNEAARRLGFKNFHAMQLHLNEQDQAEVLRLFDELDELTREPFAQAKAEIDAKLAAHCGVEIEALRPWHYHDPFFQEAPAVYEVDLDRVFADVDIVRVCQKFYAGIGLPIEDVIARSDLYEKPGKSPHAFCTDIDRQGDVRVLANIVPNEYWMGTMLHELGHSVYSSKNIPPAVPYVLRTDAHILATEGVAMMFERFAKSSRWLTAMGVPVEDPQAYDATGAKMRRDKLLIFSRWCQVMLRFEMALYDDPGQDLNRLWWDLVERYQLVTRPAGRDAPDYAAKIHVVSAPAYYHNYMMGELFACQLHAAIARDVLSADDPTSAVYYDNPAVGRFMNQRVFAPGRSLSWNNLTRYATGEDLDAKAFAAEFGGE